MKKLWNFINCRYVSNPLYVLSAIYLNIFLLLVLLSVIFTAIGNTELPNKLFQYGTYVLGILLVNGVVIVIYVALTGRKDIIDKE